MSKAKKAPIKKEELDNLLKQVKREVLRLEAEFGPVPTKAKPQPFAKKGRK